ncbi:MAG: sigma-54-dependent Fis family transcriptional regulator [Deltaproteobacteria bacterium]|nr:sigma-54-dependent Fis family transcriptional regulator [Deltaproteobacteria bacterium]
MDDEPAVCRMCERTLISEKTYEVGVASSGEEALRMLDSEPFDVLVTDLRMPGMDGLSLLRAVRTRHPQAVTILMTGYGTISSAVEAMRLGAYDYVNKPFEPKELRAAVAGAVELRRRANTSDDSTSNTAAATALARIVGDSPQMRHVRQLIRDAGPASTTVLIIGETGTGKELAARALHAASRRADERFLSVDCCTLSDSLVESELFGYVRGAFTGANTGKRGLVEVVDAGTLFFDEICNVSMDVQAKLLRFFQEREYIPVGSTEVRKVDVRLVFATNRDLGRMVGSGQFREDLFYRLHVFPIAIPPLRERREDIPSISRALLQRACVRTGKSVEAISSQAMDALVEHDWPGNVRQLENSIESATIRCEGSVIELVHLPDLHPARGSREANEAPRTNAELLLARKRIKDDAVRELETRFVLDALRRNGGNVSAAARDVGMQRTNFQTLMRLRGIKASDGR